MCSEITSSLEFLGNLPSVNITALFNKAFSSYSSTHKYGLYLFLEPSNLAKPIL